MAKGYEIERKFLIYYPDIMKLNIRKKLSILQTYLDNGEDNSQRRVRRIETDNEVSYTYTEKIFITPVTRKENEYAIDEEKYNLLLTEARCDCAPINKIRYCFEYMNQIFELDTYPFSDKYAILELELDFPEQEIIFPVYINVIKEVTGDSRYANAALATAGAFPE